MAASEKGRLTKRQIVRLAAAISTANMESIALGYLDVDEEDIDSLKDEHKNNGEQFKREVLRKWLYKNSGSNQVKVRLQTMYLTSSLTV